MPRPDCALLAALLLLAAGPAASERLELSPRRAPGDVYELALRTRSEAATTAVSTSRDVFEDDSALGYRADVTVLEIDARGMPTRERHDRVQLRFERDGRTGTAFSDGVGYEVERRGNGSVRIRSEGRRIDRALEKRIAALLEAQFEYGLAPALLDPGRPVEVGESWTLDAAAARRFLRSRGIRAIELAGPATATLDGGEDGESRGLRYTIPVARWKPAKLPANALSAASSGLVEGRIELATGRPVRHVVAFSLEARGVVTASGYAAPAPWRIAIGHRTEQRVEDVTPPVVAQF